MISATAALVLAANVVTHIQTIDTAAFTPPSPDPMGLAHIPTVDRLLVCDSEVEEIPALFTGDNLYDVDYVTGTLVSTSTTVGFSNEPTGVAFNPANGHVFISDDVKDEIFELDPGPDGAYGTADDIRTQFDTRAFGSQDPEGLTFDFHRGFLLISDGQGSTIFQVDPGPNGLFDGVPPEGDDVVSSFDTAGFGATDPEGIAYDGENRLLYMIGSDDPILFHVTTSGTLVRTIDYSALVPRNSSGLAFAPASTNPSQTHLYIADRAVDNNQDPNENDGRIYEVSVPPLPQAPGLPPGGLLLLAAALLGAARHRLAPKGS